VAVRVEPDHQRCSHDSWDGADEHDKTSVVPFVAEPAHGQYDNGTDDTTRYVEDKLSTILEMTRTQGLLATYCLPGSVAKCRQ
jgi:hypothetical protein